MVVEIPKEIRENIFDSFYTTKPVGKGVGIGLSILKTIVEEMNGTIQLDSEIDVGSNFSLLFPVVQPQINDNNQELPQSKTNELDEYLLHGTALVVDDEEGIRELLLNYLEDMGLKVETADDGDTALEMVKLKKYDYICTDMTMPRMTGDEFISQAKKYPSGQTKYYIITGGITASYSKEKEDIIKKEVEAYIYKPFTHKKIFNALSGNQKNTKK